MMVFLFIWREWRSRACLSDCYGTGMAADPVGNRIGDRTEEDGSLTDPATIRALKWAALNWATHCSFLPELSSPSLANSILYSRIALG